jgi:uncharacterized protein YebE (UPF0316 family)
MTLNEFYNSGWFTYAVIPLMIFFARICDVTVGTIRIVMVSKGHKIFAPVLGFFEVIIWLLAMSKIVQNLDNWVCYVAYGAGFATGNYVGLWLEEKLAMGIMQIQIITSRDASELINNLKKHGFGITYLEANGAIEQVAVIYSIVNRSELPQLIELIKASNPNAFYSIGEVKFVNKGVYSSVSKWSRWRKGK